MTATDLPYVNLKTVDPDGGPCPICGEHYERVALQWPRSFIRNVIYGRRSYRLVTFEPCGCQAAEG